jgi:DinB superfamily
MTAMPQMPRPEPTEYAAIYSAYVDLVPEEDILAVLARQSEILRRVADSVTEAKETYRYAPEKWSVRELVGHLGDIERVFGFRAFCFSRGETAPLPGFDERLYIVHSGYADRSLESLAGDFVGLREANLHVLRGLDAAGWERTGIANSHPISVRALAFAMAGHFRHHLAVLRERYGIGAGAL